MYFNLICAVVIALSGLTFLYLGYSCRKKEKSYDQNFDLVNSYRNHKARDLKMRQLRAKYNLDIRRSTLSFVENSNNNKISTSEKTEDNVIYIDFSSRKRKSAS